MPADDIVVEDGRCIYRPILAVAGDILTCPNGHAVADIIQDLRLGDLLMPAMFANWRGRAGWTPRSADVAAGVNGDPFPLCPICTADPWISPWGRLVPRTQLGFRCLPGDLDEPAL